MSNRYGFVAISACTLLASAAGADTIIGDLTWTAGSTVDVTEDLNIEGTLLVEPGVQIRITNGVEIRVSEGGVLSVEAAPENPAVFFPDSGRWDGIVFEAGSDGSLTGAVIRGANFAAVRVLDASPEFHACEITNVRNTSQEGDAYGILAFDASAITISKSRIYDIIAPTGDNGGGGAAGQIVGDGADGTSLSVHGKQGPNGNHGSRGGDGNEGGDAYGLRLVGGATASVISSEFFAIEGGSGGAGGFGGSGTMGGDGGDGIVFVVVGNGGKGGRGGDGGDAGHGARGGDAYAIHAADPSGTVTIAQNVIHTIIAGDGGKGGRAGFGGQGGTGGNGADTSITFACGGDGGDGGGSGIPSDGGRGGNAGKAAAVVIERAATRAVVSQNTIVDILQGARGDRGDRVNTTAASIGGRGGTGGWPNYCEGDDGARIARDNSSQNGPYGAYSFAAALSASSPDQGVQVQAVNNIFSLGETARAFAFEADDGAIIASDSNLFDTANFDDYATGSGIASLGFLFVLGDPAFADRDSGDFSLTAASAGIDAGDSAAVMSLGLTEDFAGNARVFDDPDTPNTGLFSPIDMGAFEFTVIPDCLADLAEPFGTLDLQDISVFVDAFTTEDLAADFDNNGVLDLSDIGMFVDSFLAGCP